MRELCFLSNLTSEQWAAWVQAIGSILAILAAYWISRKQFRDALTVQQASSMAERRRRYEALTGFLDATLGEYRNALAALDGSDPETHFAENSTLDLMADCHRGLQQVSPLDMPSRVGASSLVNLRDLLGTATYNAGAAFKPDSPLLGDYKRCAEALRDNIKELERLQGLLQVELDAA